MKDDSFSLMISFMVIAIVLVVGGYVAAFYVNPHAPAAVASYGFTDVKIGGWAPMSCSDSDSTCRSFTATNSKGERVSGVVGCGLFFKSCTVRF